MGIEVAPGLHAGPVPGPADSSLDLRTEQAQHRLSDRRGLGREVEGEQRPAARLNSNVTPAEAMPIAPVNARWLNSRKVSPAPVSSVTIVSLVTDTPRMSRVHVLRSRTRSPALSEITWARVPMAGTRPNANSATNATPVRDQPDRSSATPSVSRGEPPNRRVEREAEEERQSDQCEQGPGSAGRP
jgi:hypothetical protein